MALLGAGIPVLGRETHLQPHSRGAGDGRLAKEKRLPYGINLNHRFTPAARQAASGSSAGRLGEMNFINMAMWISNPNEAASTFTCARSTRTRST